VTKPVVLSDDAIADLDNIFEWVADAADVSVAHAYVGRLKSYLQSFELFPERGTLRPDLRTGLRTIGFRRQVTVAFTVRASDVLILRVVRRGQDIGTLFAPEED
jgi:toxin ParE1/3/4